MPTAPGGVTSGRGTLLLAPRGHQQKAWASGSLSTAQGQISHCHGQMCRGLQEAFAGPSPNDGRWLIAARSHRDLPAEQVPCSTLTETSHLALTPFQVGPAASLTVQLGSPGSEMEVGLSASHRPKCRTQSAHRVRGSTRF